jgi:amidase
MEFTEYRKHDATALAALVKKGDVTPRELLETAIERLEEVNPRVNAIVHRCYERARRMLADAPRDAPFYGVPFLVKDLDGVLGGEPQTGSSRSLAAYVPEKSSELFLRYERAGLGIFGKTNTPEFGIFAVTESELRGPARNPWNLDHTPGGSSGGSAAAVASGIVPVAHGGDGGGSIRIPASCCGLFGLKPTRGRNPLGPYAGEGWNGLVAPHVISRSVRDSAAILDATHGADVGAPYDAPRPERPFAEEVGRDPGKLRIGVVRHAIFGRTTAPDCAGALDHAAKLCAMLGHRTEDITLDIDRDAMVHAYLVIVAAGVAYEVENACRLTGISPARADLFEAPTWFLSQVGHTLSAYELESARATIHQGTRRVAAAFQKFDVVLTSTLAHPPVKVGELAPKAWERAGLAVLRAVPARGLLEKVLAGMSQNALEKTPNTMLFNMTGQPAMSMPLAWNGAGLPIGVQFVGRYADEATLFRLAGQLEQSSPWFDRHPA